MTFEAAVRTTPDIAGGYEIGLRAIKGEHRRKMTKTAQCRWRGSVDLEARLAPLNPGRPQWDYAIGFGYANQSDGVAYVEVHSAATTHVRDVISKKDWLTSWLDRRAPDLRALPVGGFYWVSTDGVHIRPGSPQSLRLAQHGILLRGIARIG